MQELLFLQARGGLIGILPLILLIAACMFFGIAVFWRTDPPASWNRLVAAGLLCWALAVLLQMVGGLM